MTNKDWADAIAEIRQVDPQLPEQTTAAVRELRWLWQARDAPIDYEVDDLVRRLADRLDSPDA